MLAFEKTRLTKDNKIDQSRSLGCGDFKGVTWFRRSLLFSSSFEDILVPRTSWGPEHKDQEALGTQDFEVLDFRTSGHFWFFTTFLIVFTCSCRSVSDCKFRWFKAFKRESLTRKWPEVLKSRTSNPVSPEPPGPRAQAPRRLWGREWFEKNKKS